MQSWGGQMAGKCCKVTNNLYIEMQRGQKTVVLAVLQLSVSWLRFTAVVDITQNGLAARHFYFSVSSISFFAWQFRSFHVVSNCADEICSLLSYEVLVRVAVHFLFDDDVCHVVLTGVPRSWSWLLWCVSVSFVVVGFVICWVRRQLMCQVQSLVLT